MPYHPIGIEQLSHAQIHKLLSGGRIKVKGGKHHQIHVTAEHHKKIVKAHHKGAGVMLQIDPYACQMNKHLLDQAKNCFGQAKQFAEHALGQAKHHLHGEGFLEDLRSVGSAAGSALSLGNAIPFNPFDVGYNLGHDVIGPAIMRSQGKGVRGGNLWGDIRGGVERVVRSPELKEALTIAKPLAEEAWKNRELIASMAKSSGSGFCGMGLRKKAAHKKTKAVAHKKKGGALYPAGYGFEYFK